MNFESKLREILEYPMRFASEQSKNKAISQIKELVGEREEKIIEDYFEGLLVIPFPQKTKISLLSALRKEMKGGL